MRNRGEEEANRLLVDLERMDVSTDEFNRAFAAFEQAVLDHAEHEEREEFPAVRAERSGAGSFRWERRSKQRRR